MIPAILITALVVGFFWSEDHRRQEAALKDAEARACANGLRYLLATVERDNARRLVHPIGRLAPVASVTPIRKGVER